MRRQDELLALYPGQDRLNRKFILSEVDRLSLAFDSEELLDFLQQEISEEDLLIRHQALFSLALFLPGYLRRKFSVSEAVGGVWSSYVARAKEAQRKAHEQAEERSRLRDLRRNQVFLRLSPVAQGLLSLLGRSTGRVHGLTRLVCAHYPLRRINQKLLELFRSSVAEFDLLLAFARSGGAQADGELPALLTHHAAAQTDHLLLVSSIGPALVSRTILDLARATNTLGRMNLAQALAKANVADPVEVVRHLVGFGEGWVDVYCLAALAATGQAGFIDEVVAIHRATTHPFVKSQALRAAGSLGGPRAQQLCLESLGDRIEPIKAQALESLVRMRCPRETLREAAAPLLKSPFLRARVNALLATVDPRTGTFPSQLKELLLSNDPLHRLEAAYCFGYWQSPKSLNLLKTVATADPNPQVAAQAVKAISKFPAEMALGPLLAILKERSDQVALAVSRVMTRYEGAEARHVLQVLLSALGQASNDPHRALVYRAIGTLAGKVEVRGDLAPLVRGLAETEPGPLLGALDGVKYQGRDPGPEGRRALAAATFSPDPRIACRALLDSVLLGDQDAIEKLAAKLSSPDDLTALRALEVCLELGVLASEVICEGRFPGWIFESESPPREAAPSPPPEATDQVIPCFAVVPSASIKTAQDGLDPDFDVHRVAASGSDVAQLARHLSSQQANKGSGRHLRRALTGNTYLVGNGFTDDAMGAGPLERLASRAGEVLEAIQERKLLLLVMALAVAAAVVAAFAFRAGRFPRPPTRQSPVADSSPSLKVESLEGQVMVRPPGVPLRAGDRLKIGQTVAVVDAGRLSVVVQPAGGRMELGASTEVTIDAMSGDRGRLDLTLVPGDYRFDFSSGGSFQLRLPPYTLAGSRARLSLFKGTAGLSALPQGGTVTLCRDDGTTIPLELGKDVALGFEESR
ncbi:MAG: HEAT repeat domain-containing protein [Candidatus Riflebacteria bacterium]|nr:HEAT repeat domain-containing protein [Candidatus Riflebacteria bacterium]